MQIASTLRLLVIGCLMLSYKPATEPALKTELVNKDEEGAELIRLRGHARDLKEFSSKGRYNQKIFFLVDMSLPSGRKRFFVYNSDKDSIELAGLVAHGSGQGNSSLIEFSNNVGSNCTSLGKYEIGNAYQGRFGLSFKLYGLDKSNDKAYERFVVLHSFPCIPDYEVAPDNICMSWGCPTVSPSVLNKLKGYIEHSELPILLYIYN